MSKHTPSPMAKLLEDTKPAEIEALRKRAAEALMKADNMMELALAPAEIVQAGEQYVAAGEAIKKFGHCGGKLP